MNNECKILKLWALTVNMRIKIQAPWQGWLEVVQFECLGTMKAS